MKSKAKRKLTKYRVFFKRGTCELYSIFRAKNKHTLVNLINNYLITCMFKGWPLIFNGKVCYAKNNKLVKFTAKEMQTFPEYE